ncbi:MAG: amidohydrolase [Dehalococcoidia bacterium]|nr:amidohydrolase [Dehalococcoidia bacterium]
MNDLALVNGQVVTMEGQNPLAEGVLVRGSRISFVGTSREVLERRSPHAEVIDLQGRALLPGFIDTHVHLISTGLSMMGPRLESCRTLGQVLEALAAEARKQPDIVKASGLEPATPANGLYLTRWDLDRIIPDKLAYVVRRDGHSVVVNTRTLEQLGFPSETSGIDLDPATGEPSGVLRGDARRIAGDRLTFISGNDRQEAIRLATQRAVEVGLTTVHALDGGWPRGNEDIKALLSMAPSLPVRIVVYYQTKEVGKALELGLPRIGGCLLVDGSIASHTAALTAPYNDRPDTEGMLYFSDQELQTYIREAHSSGLQISMHAIGDRAIGQLLDAYQTVLSEQPRRGHRHRIEHFLMAGPEHIENAARLGLCASMHPAFLHFSEERPNIYLERLGEQRAARVNPLSQALSSGVIVAGGSDSFVTPMDPLLGIHSAVNDHPPGSRLNVQQALEVFTINGARLAFEENEKGSIHPGKAADLVVLAENPLRCSPDAIKDIPIEMTIMDGVIRKG